jgi:DNA-binding NarL/FixJ family response regulator
MARILLIEDNENDQKLTDTVLNMLHTVEIVGTLADGKAAIAARPPDLIILDLHLPDSPEPVHTYAEIFAAMREHDVPIALLITTERVPDTPLAPLMTIIEKTQLQDPLHYRAEVARLLRQGQDVAARPKVAASG